MRFFYDELLPFLEGDGGGGSGGAGAGAAAAGDAGVTQAVAAPDRRSKRNPLAGVVYGKQPDAAPQQEKAVQDDAAKSAEDEWADIRNGRYKAQFDADVQQIVQQRLKNSKGAEESLSKLAPILESLGKKYGKDASDIDGLIAAYTDDDALYEEEAEQRGIPVSTLKTIKQLERERDEANRVNQQTAEQMRVHQHLQTLAMQAEQAKQIYPSLDLRTELANDNFRRLISPNVGIDVRTAYEIVHRDELQSAMMQYASQRTQQQVVNAIQAGQRRPAENGAKRTPALDVRDDPSKWSKQDREEVRRRVRAGEKVVL